MNTKLFSDLGLSPELLKAIDKLGFEQAAPIQAAAIPVLMQGRDVVGQSQTGSGKTAAFAIPAVEMADPQQPVVQVLILCPTRELAVQVSEEVHKLALFKRGLHALPIYGGQSYERQFQGLRQGAQIVIGTPGRLMDHMRRETLRLDKTRLVVLDEADVMLDMGFREDIELILQAVPPERQTVFFSATMPRQIRELIAKYSRNPQNVSITQKTVTVPTVEQVYYEVDRRFKVELLTRLIDIHDIKLGIIFCNTKRMVDDLADHLEAQGYSADRLHGDMSQAQRDRVMNKFRKSGLEFLVATDVAARGIDVDDVEVVFNFDLPYDVEDYVHRIGRTGRAGRSGRAISFVAGREAFLIRNIERFTNTRVHRARVPTVAEVEDARHNLVLEQLRATLQAGDFPRQDHLLEHLLEEGFTSTDIASALLHLLQGGEPAPAPRPARGQGWITQDPEPATNAPTQQKQPAPEIPRARPPITQTPLPREKSTPKPARPPQPPPTPPPAVRPEARPPRVQPHTASAPWKEKPWKEKPGRPLPPPPLARASGPRPASPRKPGPQAVPARKPKESRATPPDQTRLFMSVGSEMGVTPIDIVNLVSGETGLPGNVVGTVDIRERHLFADVSSEHANAIIAKLNRTRIKDHKIKVKLA
ncbi:MAG: DEAD/DEAH box helicase [Verrucomicrobia bacterium]|nr:DEAD/DEAH box helicase [Verrucomicrobiota bacterium]